MSKKSTTFKRWLTEKWYEHKDEIFDWERRITDETPEHYFKKYRWYLKALYKHERRQDELSKKSVSK